MIDKEYVINNISSDDVYLYQDIKEVIDELGIKNDCKENDFITLDTEVNPNTIEIEKVTKYLGKREYDPKELIIAYRDQVFVKLNHPTYKKICKQALYEYKRAYIILSSFEDEIENADDILTICDIAMYFLELIINTGQEGRLVGYSGTLRVLRILRDLYETYKEYLEVE